MLEYIILFVLMILAAVFCGQPCKKSVAFSPVVQVRHIAADGRVADGIVPINDAAAHAN